MRHHETKSYQNNSVGKPQNGDRIGAVLVAGLFVFLFCVGAVLDGLAGVAFL